MENKEKGLVPLSSALSLVLWLTWWSIQPFRATVSGLSAGDVVDIMVTCTPSYSSPTPSPKSEKLASDLSCLCSDLRHGFILAKESQEGRLQME